MTVKKIFSRYHEEEKKEDTTYVGNRSDPDRKEHELFRPTPRRASTETQLGDSGSAGCHAAMRCLSRSLKRDLSINDSIGGTSSHNLPSLSKTLKRNLSKGSLGPNETFPTLSGMEETASLPIGDNRGANKVNPAGSSIGSPVYMPQHLARPRPTFQPNQVTWVPNQPPRLFSGVGSVFSSASAPKQGLVRNKDAGESMRQFTSVSLLSKKGLNGTLTKEKPKTSAVSHCDKEKAGTPADETQQQEQQELGLPRVLSAPRLCEDHSSCKVQGDEFPNLPVETSPDCFYKAIIGQLGYSSDPISSLQLKDYFLEYTQEQFAAYDHAVTGAVRSDDVNALRELFRKGKTMQCSNKFGESIVHMACRKGSLPVIRFLLGEANVSLRVRDDFGRTPIHDACWASRPSFEAIQMLIRKEPDLLLLADRRGNTPLSYVRMEKWGVWCDFLRTSGALLAPKVLVKPNEEN